MAIVPVLRFLMNYVDREYGESSSYFATCTCRKNNLVVDVAHDVLREVNGEKAKQ